MLFPRPAAAPAHVDLSIRDLPAEYGRMRGRGLYCLNAGSLQDALVLCAAALEGLEARDRALAIGMPQAVESLVSMLSEGGRAHGLRAYAIEALVPKALRILARDVDRALRPVGRFIILLLPSEDVLAMDLSLDDWLIDWRWWLYRNGCTLLLVFHGTRADAVPDIRASNEALCGLASLVCEDGAYRYAIRHWRNQHGVAGEVRIGLEKRDGAFHALARRAGVSPRAHDCDEVRIEGAALAGGPAILDPHWTVYERAEDLHEQALVAEAATIVFACEGRQDLAGLARRLHALRRQRGPAIKLVVREVGGALRDRDHELLMDCGATLVVPRGVHAAQFLRFLETVQGGMHVRPLIDDPEAALAAEPLPESVGIVGAERFLDYLGALGKSAAGASSGVLVVLEPVPGLGPEAAMSRLRLRRQGDAACALGDLVLLFLSNCPPNLAEAALGEVFRMDHGTLFSDYRIHADPADIGAQALLMRRRLSGLPRAHGVDDEARRASIPGPLPPYRPRLLAAGEGGP